MVSSTVKLRELKTEDVADITRLMTPKISSFLWSVTPYTLEGARDFIDSCRKDFESSRAIYFAVESKNKPDSYDTLIGCVSLIEINGTRKKATLGMCWIGEQYWGMGIGKECIRLVIEYAFSQLGLNQVNGLVFPENKASIRMLEKNGMRKIGWVNRYYELEGRYRDLLEYQIYRDSYFVQFRYAKRVMVRFVLRFLRHSRVMKFARAIKQDLNQ